LLVVNRAAHRAEVDRHAAALAAASLGSPAGDANLDRATSALHMYVAWETVEEFDEALARVEAGVYGTCLSCARPVPFERLETSPQMRFCPTCGEARSEPPRRRAVARRRRS
jgi:RNA polymerase-binding transcription factor DksA